jgi:hypothetical protein
MPFNGGIEMTLELKINPAFRDLLDLPSDEERKELERQLVRDGGPQDPIIVWKGHNIIVDGHNRYAICVAHNLKFAVREKEFADEDAVKDWILEFQLSRRNLTPARASYFMGVLYNRSKQDPTKQRQATADGKTTAEVIGEKFGVSEKTVRRAGEYAKGVDAVGKVKNLTTVKEKLAAIKDKNASFSKGELNEIGKAPTPEIATKAVEILLKEKATAAKKNIEAAAKKTTTPPAPKSTVPFPVIFAKPNFERHDFNVAKEERPPMAENCMVYIAVPDEELPTGMELLKRWGLKYEASFVFKCDRYEGMWSDINHIFLLAASKGEPLERPKKMVMSLNAANGPVEDAMMKLITSYHPNLKSIDMRKAG